jgi:hypothetical protein
MSDTTTGQAGTPALMAEDRRSRPPQPWVVLVRALGCVLAAGLLCVTTSVLVSYYFQRTVEETRVISDPVDEISGRVNRGAIVVRARDDASSVTISSKRRYSFGQPQVTTSLSGGRLSMGSSCDEHRGSIYGTCSVHLDVTVPRGIELDLTTSKGEVELESPDAGIRLTTASGSVQVTGATSPTVDISTAAGGVRLEFAKPPGDVIVRTAAGSITIVVPADGTVYNVTGSTSLGKRKIDVPQDATSRHRIDASSSVGSVTVSTR